MVIRWKVRNRKAREYLICKSIKSISSTTSSCDTAYRWRDINDPDKPAPDREPGLDALFEEIRVTVSQEAQIIQAVFPEKEEVMKVFLQRVFAQVVRTPLTCCEIVLSAVINRYSNNWNTFLRRHLHLATLHCFGYYV